jgi:hypothetical protein
MGISFASAGMSTNRLRKLSPPPREHLESMATAGDLSAERIHSYQPIIIVRFSLVMLPFNVGHLARHADSGY